VAGWLWGLWLRRVVRDGDVKKRPGALSGMIESGDVRRRAPVRNGGG
jgi:hypothetical protein